MLVNKRNAIKHLSTVIELSLFALMILAFSACGRAPQAVAEKSELIPNPSLRRFPRENWSFEGNTIFLWRENVTPKDIKTARESSDRIDELNEHVLKLAARISEITQLVDGLQDRLTSLVDSLNKDTDKAEVKKKAISELQSRIAFLEKYGNQLKEDREEAVSQSNAELDRLGRLVDLFDPQPSSVSFTFLENGSIKADLLGWDVADGEGPREFTTHPKDPAVKPTIGSVSYVELGGTFEFYLYVFGKNDPVNARERYHFKVSRARYDRQKGTLDKQGSLSARSPGHTMTSPVP